MWFHVNLISNLSTCSQNKLSVCLSVLPFELYLKKKMAIFTMFLWSEYFIIKWEKTATNNLSRPTHNYHNSPTADCGVTTTSNVGLRCSARMHESFENVYKFVFQPCMLEYDYFRRGQAAKNEWISSGQGESRWVGEENRLNGQVAQLLVGQIIMTNS